MDVLVKSYTEKGYKPIPSLWLPPGEYGRGLQCFAPACTDIVPIDVNRRIIYLVRRKSKPVAGWWWLGGRLPPRLTKEEGVVMNFKRETKVHISQKRFQLVAVFDYRCKDRAQWPYDMGCHMVVYTYTVELNQDELARVSANLDEEEYERNAGLSDFNRERLVGERVRSNILDLYDHVFPPQ